MRREELAFAIDLAAQEGWNPGVHDVECFFAADPKGFLIGELRGEPVGCVSAVSYAGRYGFLGLYIVRPQFRGRGYGMRLWDSAMARLRGHNVGLDGVGPLAAEDAVIARRLYEAAAAYAPDRDPIFVDVPEANPRATSFLAALNLTPAFETARMYTGADPAIDLAQLFGVTTLELG